MLSSNINLRSGTVGYNNRIPVSDGNLVWGKMIKLILFGLAKISHKVVQLNNQLLLKKQKPTNIQIITHNEEKLP